jgi:hypothetical protein
MKAYFAPVFALFVLFGCDTASNVHKTVNQPKKNMEVTCHISEQSVHNSMRTCIYKCQDGSPETASTESQFTCPATIFKRI